MNWSRKYATLLLLAAAMFSCGVEEDLSDCLPEVPVPPTEEPEPRTIKAVFVYAACDIDLTQERFECASLYVFDGAGGLVSVRELDNPVFNEVFDTGWTFDAGDYQFVAWVNCVEPYSLTDCENRADGRLVLNVPAGGYVTGDLPWLLYGEKNCSIADPTDEQVVVIPVKLNNDVVKIEVTGIPPSDDEYEFVVGGGNNTLDFGNKPDGSGNDFSYSVPAHFENGVLTGEINTIGLDENGSVLTIVDKTTGKVIWPVSPDDENNLTDLIDQTGQVNSDTTHDYDIEIELTTGESATELHLVKVTVNGWGAKKDDYAVHPQ